MHPYKTNMMCSQITRCIYKVIASSPELVNMYHHKLDNKQNASGVSIIKVIPSTNNRAYTIHYIIDGNNIDKDFIRHNKREIIHKLKKMIRKRKFPQLTFKYDHEYENEIQDYIRRKLLEE